MSRVVTDVDIRNGSLDPTIGANLGRLNGPLLPRRFVLGRGCQIVCAPPRLESGAEYGRPLMDFDDEPGLVR
jgi:hypothetical protein